MTTRRKLAAIYIAVTLPVLISSSAAVQAAPSRASIQERIEELGQEISRLDEDYNVARLKVSSLEGQIRDTEYKAAQADEDLVVLRKKTSERAAALYRVGAPKTFSVLLTAESFRDFQHKMTVLSAVNTWEVSIMEDLEIADQKAARLTESLRSDAAQRRTTLKALGAKRAELDLKIAQQRNLLARSDAAAAARVTKTIKTPRPTIDFANLPASPRARIAVQTAYEQIGKPYRYGAAGPNSFDCSGLTMFVWGRAGVSIPHGTRAQYNATKRVARADLQPGDIVYYFGQWRHAGLYIGGGKMIHSVHPGVNVRIDSIDYISGYAGAGRPGV